MTNPLIARFAGEPALVEPAQAARFEACVEKTFAFLSENQDKIEAASATEDFWNTDDRWLARFRPYNVVNGILQIPVKGVLLHNFPYAFYDLATGYEYIWEAFRRGCGDFATGAIKGIALVCDTPGGMVAGCFDARDKMIALKEETSCPVAGFAHEAAYSAGYAMITTADRGQIHVSRTGGVGSIGVVTGHMSVAGAMDKAGLVFTYIYAGEGKVDGNPYEALSDDAKARIQARIDELYGIFVSAVARSRGLEESAIRETLGAHCYTATQATSNGLADQIGSLDDALSAFAGFLDAPSESNGEDDMADEAKSTVDQVVHDQAVAAARADGEKAGATAERARVNAILGSDEGKTRPKAALSAALKTDMSVEQASAFLGDLPEEKAESTQGGDTPFSNEMNRAENQPGVGASGGGNGADTEADDIVALRALASGVGMKGFDASTSK